MKLYANKIFDSKTCQLVCDVFCDYKGEFIVSHGSHEANAKSIMSLVSLGIKKEDLLEFKGDKELEVILSSLINDGIIKGE